MAEGLQLASLSLTVLQVGILTAVFFRLGKLCARIEEHHRRLMALEQTRG